jgi:uncharacterized protein (DUF1330 family)
MKSGYKIAAAVIGSFVLGVGVASVLHAQAKPPGYVFAEIDVKDQDAYAKDYLPKAQGNIEAFGGKRIAGGFNKAIGLRGAAPPNRVVLLQFPDMDALKAFEAKERKLQAEVGVDKYASFRVIGIEGATSKARRPAAVRCQELISSSLCKADGARAIILLNAQYLADALI